GGAERADIHKLHRLGALLTLVATVAAGLVALRADLGATAIAVIALVMAEFFVGVAAILTDLPIGVAVAHNWLAAMLILGLLGLLALSRNQRALS
ncbi:MAG: heme A synthase, partial [Gammaproteobacteria bacterium]|nr:heme A synthase [Gammaproteobacteria bacterium]